MKTPRLTEVFVESIGAPPHGDTGPEWKKYHDWLKLPQNWNNMDLVSYIPDPKTKQLIKGKHTDGKEYRNCNVCGSTLVRE